MRKQVLAVTIGVLLVLSVFSVLQFWQIKVAQASDTLIDSYASTNGDNLWVINSLHPSAVASQSVVFQTFTSAATPYKITSAKFMLQKTGSPNGTLYYELYAMTGTSGTDGTPTGSALAVSAGLDVSTLTTSPVVTELAFNSSQQYVMSASTNYTICVGFIASGDIDGSNMVQPRLDVSSPSDDGNTGKYANSVWTGVSTYDAIFYVYGLPESEVPTFIAQSPNATTINTVCLFSCNISDNIGVSGYVFGTNNTGSWANETWTTLSGVASAWANVSKTLNSTAGHAVQFKWWANDTSNNNASSSMQSLTTTSGTHYLSINSTAISTTYTINGTISGASITASSGSPSDIQTAVNTIAAAGGGTVYVPAGDFTFNPPAVSNGKGVTIPIGVNIIGAGIGITILRESTDIAFDNSVKTFMFYLAWTADTNKTNRISGISFIGHVHSDLGDKVAVYLEGRKDFRIDHCAFQDFPSQGIYVRNSRGVIDHCDFDNPYHDNFPPKSNPAGQPWAVWGYGIIVIGQTEASWVNDISTLLGRYDSWGDAHPAVYIENCNFTRCRHAISSNTNGWYVSRFNNFTTATPYGQLDIHGGSPGGRGMESYNNTFNLSDESYSFGQDSAMELRGGGGVSFNNTVYLNPSYGTDTLQFSNDGEAYPYDVRSFYAWNNSAYWTNGTAVSFNSKISTISGVVENTNYFLRAPTLALDGFTYTPYVYPHPLATITNTGTTNSTIALDEATYSVTVLSQVISGGYTYNFTEWQDSSTNTTIIVTLTANATITATYIDISVVTISITLPSNSTYDSSTIAVSFTASGGTIDKKWFNVKNGTSWIYASNQTYPDIEIMTGFVNGTQYTLYAFANNTDGTEGYATVMFSVEIPLQPTGGTNSLIVNTWWSMYW